MLDKIKEDFKSFYLPLILSIVISYVFYLISIKDRIPVFTAEPLKTRIIDASTIASAPIQVIGPNSRAIKNDLSAVTFHLWNRGGEAIDSIDVLKPLYISLSDTSAKFIDIKINKVSRLDITRVNLALDKSQKKVLINFAILDEGDGFTCQTIFEGNPNSELIINGAIKGVKGFDNPNVSVLEFASITIALCALATLAIMLAVKLFTLYVYVTYKDRYVDDFYYYLDKNQLEKAEVYTVEGKRDSEIFKQLFDTYSQDKAKFNQISEQYIKEIQQKAKHYFDRPFIEHPVWEALKKLLYVIVYIVIGFNTWALLRENPGITNPINKSNYYFMIKNIIQSGLAERHDRR
ncbi:hypothetical protein [Hymenobacter ruber]